MKGSLIIVSFFIIGTLCGVYHLIPYDFTDSKLSYYAPVSYTHLTLPTICSV